MTAVVISNVVFLLLIFFSISDVGETAKRRSCPENFHCVPIEKCQFLVQEELLYPCKNGAHICCPKIQNEIEKTTTKYVPHYTIGTTMTTSDPKFIFEEESDNNMNENKYNHTEKLDNNINNITGQHSTTTNQFEKIRFNVPDYNNENKTNSTSVKEHNEVNDIHSIENKVKHPDEKEINRSVVVSRRDPFKKNCGIALATDKITGGQNADLGQFPWMALLGFKHPEVERTQFLCGGSLITNRHVLTAAHCIIENRPLKLRSVRLGEHNLTSQRDCVQYGKDKICADLPVEIQIQRYFVHEEFNRTDLKNDIALIQLKQSVKETDYIRTICLPFDRDFSDVNFTGQSFTVSGWGKLKSDELFGANVLQFTKVQTWDPQKCKNAIPTEVRPLTEKQLCANGPNTQDSCKGDSGGPLINTTLVDREVKHIQLGIVSFGTTTCGDPNLPSIYTRVDKYLQWIVDKVSTNK